MNVDETKTISWTPEVEGAEEASVEVTVKGVKERKLPELTDEFAKTNFGFDGIDARRRQAETGVRQALQLPQLKENRAASKPAERLELDEMDEDYEQSVFQELGQNFCRASPLAA